MHNSLQYWYESRQLSMRREMMKAALCIPTLSTSSNMQHSFQHLLSMSVARKQLGCTSKHKCLPTPWCKVTNENVNCAALLDTMPFPWFVHCIPIPARPSNGNVVPGDPVRT